MATSCDCGDGVDEYCWTGESDRGEDAEVVCFDYAVDIGMDSVRAGGLVGVECGSQAGCEFREELCF